MGEACGRTYERLLSFPVTVNTLILGDVVAGMLYGIIINVIILASGTAAFSYAVSLLGVLLIAISLLLGAFCFSTLGVLLASPASTNPSNVMMLSSLVRFPLIFISGIFVPIASLQGVARVASTVRRSRTSLTGLTSVCWEAPRSRSCWVGPSLSALALFLCCWPAFFTGAT